LLAIGSSSSGIGRATVRCLRETGGAFVSNILAPLRRRTRLSCRARSVSSSSLTLLHRRRATSSHTGLPADAAANGVWDMGALPRPARCLHVPARGPGLSHRSRGRGLCAPHRYAPGRGRDRDRVSVSARSSSDQHNRRRPRTAAILLGRLHVASTASASSRRGRHIKQCPAGAVWRAGCSHVTRRRLVGGGGALAVCTHRSRLAATGYRYPTRSCRRMPLASSLQRRPIGGLGGVWRRIPVRRILGSYCHILVPRRANDASTSYPAAGRGDRLLPACT